MSRRLFTGILATQLLASALTAQEPSASAADAVKTTTYNSDTLNLRFTYPSYMHQRDAAEAMQSGHLAIFGSSGVNDPEHLQVVKCLHPALLLNTPNDAASQQQVRSEHQNADGSTTVVTHAAAPEATVLLAELDPTCLTPEQQAKAEDLLAAISQTIAHLPGMSPIGKPLWYKVGRQKIHMAASQGHLQMAGQTSAGAVGMTAFSTNWENHFLIWFFESNNVALMNRLTKSVVAFGRETPAPLFPASIGQGPPIDAVP